MRIQLNTNSIYAHVMTLKYLVCRAANTASHTRQVKVFKNKY